MTTGGQTRPDSDQPRQSEREKMGPLFRIHDNARLILRLLLIIVPISVAVGLVVALFLWLLSLATVTPAIHLWLLYLLPVAGLVIVFSYRVAGKNVEAGNNLILDEIHAPGGAKWYSWALKLLLTAITLAAGFKGEEVTQLFFIGAQMVSSVYVLGTDFWNKLKHCL